MAARTGRRLRVMGAALAVAAALPASGPAGAQTAPGCDTYASVVHDAVHGDVRCEAWTARYNDPVEAYDGPIRGNRAMATSPDGSVLYVGGHSLVDEGSNDLDVVLLAYDTSTGAPRFAARYEGEPQRPRALAYAMDVDPTGEDVYLLVTVTELPNGAPTSLLLSFDARTGDLRWTAPLIAPWGTRGSFASIEVAQDGSRVYATGTAGFKDADGKSFLFGVTTAIEARDPEHLGEQVWTTSFDAPHGSFARHVAVDGDGGRVFVGGSVLRPNGRRDGFTTLAYEAKEGAELWRAHAPGAFPDDQGIPAMAGLAVSPDGTRVFATGADQLEDQGPASFNVIRVLAYDGGTGEELWDAKVGGQFPTGGDGPRSGLFIEVGSPIAVRPDGSAVYVAGTLADFGTIAAGQGERYALVTAALDPGTGAELWRNEFDEGRPRRTFWPYLPAVAVSEDDVFVTATRGMEAVVPFVIAFGEHQFNTQALDASTGTTRWVGRWGEGQSRTAGIAITPDGSRLFVTGDSTALEERYEGSTDLVTLAYDTAT